MAYAEMLRSRKNLCICAVSIVFNGLLFYLDADGINDLLPHRLLAGDPLS